MKASAGSGKTYNLAKTYIRLLLSQDDVRSYRHILAVTFTNKATEEMKSRILKELHVLATRPESSSYLDDLLPGFGTVKALQDRSAMALSNILHDYGAFAISTIDRFFQQTLKAFSREIGQFASYQVELDTKSLVDESVDRVLDSLSEDNPGLLKWLTQSVMDELQKGNRYNLEKKLKDMALNLKSDEHRAMVEAWGVDEEAAYSKENLSRLKKSLRGVVSSFRDEVVGAAQAFLSACGENGVSLSDFSGPTMKALVKYAELKAGDKIEAPSDALYDRAEDYSKWFRKADRERFSCLEGTLMPLLKEFCGLFAEPFRVHNTAIAISDQLSELGIAGDLYREFNDLLKEKNVLSLDDSNVILKNIIDGSDAPFVYEKLGVRFEHFLLDEFQDTSRIQWCNFLPLVSESNASGNENLLVGDVKQSIYRWRGSDWKMMAGEVQSHFPDCTDEPLDSNYRSLANIVNFNNGFFRYSAARLDSMLGDEHEELEVSSIYSDCKQAVKVRDKAEGSVDVVFCKPESEFDAIVMAMGKVQEKGARLGDIAILVRDNKQGSEIAMLLIENGFSVISDDSLRLKSSSVVRQAVSLLSTVGDSDDSIGSFLASEMGVDVHDIDYLSLPDLCETLLRLVKTRDENLFSSQTQYIQSFMDFVQDHVSVHGNAIDAFLKAWEDADPKISSPSDPDSIRVMTIHKSKGLEFDHVIIPHAEKTILFRAGAHWARPDLERTELEGIAEGIYHVTLSKPQNDKTLFGSECTKELYLQYIDNINTFYVAMTRAAKGLTVIAAMPDAKCISNSPAACDLSVEDCSRDPQFDYSNFSQLLFHYLEKYGAALDFDRCLDEEAGAIYYSKGEIYDYASMERDETNVGEIVTGYPSIPLNPGVDDEGVDVRERGRLKFSADSIDFFRDEARASRSKRLNGTVMHGILSEVIVPEDLPAAVAHAVEIGDIAPSDSDACLEQLGRAISSHPEWFDASAVKVLSEVSLIDTDGREYRPDRVVVRDGSVTVIDYKFGEKNPKYRRQVSRYADIYRRLGYLVDKAVVWYVPEDEVE